MCKTYIRSEDHVKGFQWDGKNMDELREFINETKLGDYIYIPANNDPFGFLPIHNKVYGSMVAIPGDYIIDHPIYGLMPIRPNIFEEEYKEVKNIGA